MKKILLLGSCSILLFSACTKTNTENSENLTSQQITTLPKKRCGSHEAMQKAYAKDPSLKLKREAIEKFIQQNEKKIADENLTAKRAVIPVIVNVLYRTAQENISMAQIRSQIDVLNEDFNAKNVEYNQVPALFGNVKTNVGFSFELVKVVRKFANKTQWVDESMKFNSEGGINAVSTKNTLNIWVVNHIVDQGEEILGYAYLPGVEPAYDGLVIGYNFFGRTGAVLAPYHKGRTATHEIGHWMNLEHMWGDGFCGTDFVNDTPQHDDANGGCPAYPHLSKCNGKPVEMTMNYMDYTNDACMGMFTYGQKNRARVIFHAGGPRANFFK